MTWWQEGKLSYRETETVVVSLVRSDSCFWSRTPFPLNHHHNIGLCIWLYTFVFCRFVCALSCHQNISKESLCVNTCIITDKYLDFDCGISNLIIGLYHACRQAVLLFIMSARVHFKASSKDRIRVFSATQSHFNPKALFEINECCPYNMARLSKRQLKLTSRGKETLFHFHFLCCY